MATPYGMFAPGASVGGGPRTQANLDPLLELLTQAGQFVTTTSKPHWQQMIEQRQAEAAGQFAEQGPPLPAALTQQPSEGFAEQGPPASAATPAGGYRGQMVTPVGGAAQPATEALPDLTTAPEDESFVPLLQRLAPSLYRSATDDMTGTIYPTVDSGTSVPLPEQRKTSDEDQAGGVPLVGEEEIQREFEKLPYKDYPSEMVTQGARGDRTAGMGNLPEGAVEQPDMPETLQTKRPGLLGRLGGMIKDNPEVAAQIAQAAGGLMSNIARGRAEREAGRETEGRVARANLISALTGGRARPQVTAAQADEGGLLSRLGQITTAGGRIATGEMERRRAEDVEERGIGLKERQVDTMERRLDIMQDKINKDYQADLAAANAELAKATGASYERVQGGIENLNKATKIYEGGGYLDPTQGHKNLYGQMRVLWSDYDDDATPANVAAIFQVYQRFFDPATVREGDLRILQEAEGTFRQLQAMAERLVGAGGSLSSDTVEEMKRITDKVHGLQVAKAKEDVAAYIDVAIAPQDREATMQYYDKIFTLPPLLGAGGAAELTEALQSGEIILE
jgi:hypothetical protein